jgi:hypothetical protein
VSSKAFATQRGLLGDRAYPQTLEADRGGEYPVSGLDVHKKSISVATVDGSARAEVRFYGTIENTPDAVRVLCKKLCKDGRQLHACYEAGPCGYKCSGIQLGHRCGVAAPSLIPCKAGGKVKSDRHSAEIVHDSGVEPDPPRGNGGRARHDGR